MATVIARSSHPRRRLLNLTDTLKPQKTAAAEVKPMKNLSRAGPLFWEGSEANSSSSAAIVGRYGISLLHMCKEYDGTESEDAFARQCAFVEHMYLVVSWVQVSLSVSRKLRPGEIISPQTARNMFGGGVRKEMIVLEH
jgi:hypothetical protein